MVPRYGGSWRYYCLAWCWCGYYPTVLLMVVRSGLESGSACKLDDRCVSGVVYKSSEETYTVFRLRRPLISIPMSTTPRWNFLIMFRHSTIIRMHHVVLVLLSTMVRIRTSVTYTAMPSVGIRETRPCALDNYASGSRSRRRRRCHVPRGLPLRLRLQLRFGRCVACGS